MEESKLVTQAQAGDEHAWELLMQRYQEPVFRLAYLFVGDAADADDVAQEAFIHAFRGLARFDASRPLKPWLLRITANLARNRRRAAGRYMAMVRRLFRRAVDPVAVAPPPLPTPWEQQALWQAIQRLNQKDQEILYLRYFLELSEAEAAEALAVAQGTVKSRLHRAVQRLRVIVVQEFPMLQEGREDERATA